MEGQTKGGTHPGQMPRRLVRQCKRAALFLVLAAMVVIEESSSLLGAARLGRLFRHVVMVKVKVALHEEHCQEPSQHPRHRNVSRAKLLPGMRHKMQDPHSEH